ncbi:hypothetical protein [Psychromonas sp. SP041]|uniref:hypothetical protein n=1 Tax=Psychromonas sp. SP041 TaxID=1365007 RepID=UPI0010C788DC|nr:hypothetical protein [Psychromonas sp. SP041]
MSYKQQIEWLKKNYFNLNIYDFKKSNNKVKINEDVTRMDDVAEFILSAGSVNMKVFIKNESFISANEQSDNKGPFRIRQEMIIDDKKSTVDKKRILEDGEYKYEGKNDFPESIRTMIGRSIQNLSTHKPLMLSDKHYETYQKNLEAMKSNDIDINDTRQGIMDGLGWIKDDIYSCGKVDKDIVNSFIDNEIELLKSLLPEGMQLNEEVEILGGLKRLGHRAKDVDKVESLFSDIEKSIDVCLDQAKASFNTEPTIDDQVACYKAAQLDYFKEIMKSKINEKQAGILVLKNSISEKEEFITNMLSINANKEVSSTLSNDPAQFQKLLDKEVESLQEAESECDALIAQAENAADSIEALGTKMRLVPNELFERLSSGIEPPLEGVEQKMQADLNASLLNSESPKLFLRFVQKFSGDEQDSIVYFAMKNDGARINKMIDAHENNELQKSSENEYHYEPSM